METTRKEAKKATINSCMLLCISGLRSVYTTEKTHTQTGFVSFYICVMCCVCFWLEFFFLLLSRSRDFVQPFSLCSLSSVCVYCMCALHVYFLSFFSRFILHLLHHFVYTSPFLSYSLLLFYWPK